jgi:tetratricopeptide (TPR) repeat protein
MKTVFIVLLLSAIVSKSFSQEKFPALSAKGKIVQKVGFTTIKIDYERPSARGRKIFGELVPYDKIWKTGAGYCPKINFDDDVEIGGNTVKAGTYSLLSVPAEREWTIILNKDTTLYGTDFYNEKLDAIRIPATSERTSRYYESFTLDVDIVPNNADIYLSWANCQVHFKLGTNSDRRTSEFIQAYLVTGRSNDPDEYATAAEYYIYQNKELDKAMSLLDKAIGLKEKAWYYRLKTDILESQKKYVAAIDLLNFLVNSTPKMSKEFGWSAATERQMIEGYDSRIDSIKKKLAQSNGR